MTQCCEVGTHKCDVQIDLVDNTICADKCIADIVTALNQYGLETIGSCCGHGKTTGIISLADGRNLIVSADAAVIISLKSLVAHAYAEGTIDSENDEADFAHSNASTDLDEIISDAIPAPDPTPEKGTP